MRTILLIAIVSSLQFGVAEIAGLNKSGPALVTAIVLGLAAILSPDRNLRRLYDETSVVHKLLILGFCLIVMLGRFQTDSLIEWVIEGVTIVSGGVLFLAVGYRAFYSWWAGGR